ncbi:MAG: hypothetical protein ACYTGZ_10955 [Planctomycetota bacterium]
MQAAVALLAAAFIAGLASAPARGQEKGSIEERLKEVRREVKVINLETSMPRLPALIEREKKYSLVLDQISGAALNQPELMKGLFEKARTIKLAALKDLNEILRKHKGKHVGITEKQVWERLKTRFVGVSYEDEWLVNILDDIEEAACINVELDARVYKFDSVTFDFESSSARAMLQMMGDELFFQWIVRGDTLYVYKERNEVLFGKQWARDRKRAQKERAKEEKRMREARKRRLGGDDE